MRKALIIVGVMLTMVGFFGSLSAKESFDITSLHTTLAEGKQWLNTERPLQAEDLKGRVMLVDFWTFCCINCIHVIPKLQQLEHMFGNKLTVIGVHSAKFQNERDTTNIRNAILRYGIEHPVINDSDFNIWQQFAVRAWPTLILISPTGTIYRTYAGEGDVEEIAADIQKLLKTYGDKINTSPLPLALEKNKSAPTYLSFPGKIVYTGNHDGAPALFISDSSHDRVLGVRIDGQTFFEMDGFRKPQGLLYKDGILYVADTENHQLKKVDIKNKTVEVLAGTGERGMILLSQNRPAKTTAMASPWDLAFYPDANHIAIAMAGTHQLWSYDINEKSVSVLAGNGREYIDDGAFPYNSLSQPSGLSVHNGNLYFVDSETSSLRVLEKSNVKTLIGTGLFDFGLRDGDANSALMQHALGLTVDDRGVYIADSYNHAIRFYDFETRKLSTLVQPGTLNEPNAIIKAGSLFFIADTNNNRIMMMDNDSKKLKEFEIKPYETPVSYIDPKKLPNLVEEHDQQISSALTEITLDLPQDWKINHDAPSYLALFQIKDKKKIMVTSFNTSDLEKRKVYLKHLDDDATYFLQGTLYYCPKENPSQCLIQSHHQTLRTMEKSKSTITIKLAIS